MVESKLPKGVPAGAFDEIHLAARNRDAAKVAALLEAGADPNLLNQKEPNGDGGNTPLWFAAQGTKPGGVPVAQVLLGAGARIDERCEYGTTALHLAVAWAHLDMVEFLIANGANAHARDDNGRTPLEMARADCLRMHERKRLGGVSPEVEYWLERVPAVMDLLSSHQS
jgi:hypothetical protein